MNGRRCRLPLKVTSANLQKNQKKTGGETPPKAHAEHSVKKNLLKDAHICFWYKLRDWNKSIVERFLNCGCEKLKLF